MYRPRRKPCHDSIGGILRGNSMQPSWSFRESGSRSWSMSFLSPRIRFIKLKKLSSDRPWSWCPHILDWLRPFWICYRDWKERDEEIPRLNSYLDELESKIPKIWSVGESTAFKRPPCASKSQPQWKTLSCICGRGQARYLQVAFSETNASVSPKNWFISRPVELLLNIPRNSIFYKDTGVSGNIWRATDWSYSCSSLSDGVEDFGTSSKDRMPGTSTLNEE